MRQWIRGGMLVDPAKETIAQRDVLVDNGKILMIRPVGVIEEGPDVDRIIDAAGMYVVPGLIDMHVHLRQPGQEYKETIATGTLAAVAGGFTAVACMPNTDPPNDSRAVTEFIIHEARSAGHCPVFPIAAITQGRRGERLSEFWDLKEGGAVAVSDDGNPVMDSEVMRRALEYAAYCGLMVISHCEDLRLSKGGVVHEGCIATELGLPGIPSASEAVMVYRDISLSRLTGCPVHIAHVSTAESVGLIKRAKDEGIRVTAETAPHYFTLTHEAARGYDTNAKINPPLRTPEDVAAIQEGLREGVIDVIATDHAPHSPDDKVVEFEKAAFGIVGLETALSLTLALVTKGVLSLPRAIAKLSTDPARILGLPGGILVEGGPADLALVDAEVMYVLGSDALLSKSRNTPFIGRTLQGMNRMTMIGGRVVWERSPENTGR